MRNIHSLAKKVIDKSWFIEGTPDSVKHDAVDKEVRDFLEHKIDVIKSIPNNDGSANIDYRKIFELDSKDCPMCGGKRSE